MLDSFLTFINQQGLVPESEICLLAVSGGVDSVVLAHLFHKLGWPAAIAHCNFGLRGEESDGDEEFVKELAARYGFDFYSKSFDVKSFANKRSVSTQMAARELRYSWFEEIRRQNGYRWIATAHHINDSFETILLNLVRGTGLPGLQGISGKRDFLLRPLLLASKQEILAYANEHGLEWREDRSNDTDDYKRNMVRHKIIPLFQQLNPSLEDTFKTTSERLRGANSLLNEFLEKWKTDSIQINHEDVRIPISLVLSASEPIYRLWYILQNYGFTYLQVRQAIASMPGKSFISATYILLVDRKEFIIKARGENREDYQLLITEPEGRFSYGYLSINLVPTEWNPGAPINYETSTIFLDPAKLEFPLSIRKWKVGDVFEPFGMKGKHKKLSDLFIDLKMNRFEKENANILLNGNGQIIWVIGIRFDERYRVDDSVTKVISISISNKI